MSLQLFFERLREEREARRFTQDVMAMRVGVSKRSYCAYESGETAPSAKLLAALADMGVDVVYLLTGHRNKPVVETFDLSPRQRALLDNYEHTDEQGKKIIEATASAAAKPADVKAGRGKKAA